MRWLQRSKVYAPVDEGQHGGGGGGSGLGEDQLSFLAEMIGDETSGTEDVSFDEKVEESSETSSEPESKAEGESLELEKAEPEIEEEPQVDETTQTIQSLREQILALTEALQQDPLKQTVKEDVKGEGSVTDVKMESKKTQEVLQQFLTDDELDRLIDEPNLINLAFQRSQNAMVSSIGELVQVEVQKQILVNKAITDFYTENQDLLPYAKFVQFVMHDVENKNRDKTYAEIFKATADESRKRLGLTIKGTPERNKTNNGSQKPAFAGSKKGNSRPSGKPDIFDEAARDMMS